MSLRCVVVVLVTLSAMPASADVLPDDWVAPACAPVSCLPGSLPGGGGHGSCPSLCVPWSQTCRSDAECGGPGWSCVPTRFCLDRMPTGRMIQDVVVGECAADDSCVSGTCAITSRCMPTPGPPVVHPPGTVPTVAGAEPTTVTTTTPAGVPGSAATESAPPSEGGSMCSARHRAARSTPLVFFALALALALCRGGRR